MPSDAIKRTVRGATAPVGRVLDRIGVTANGVTIFGLLFAAGCGAAVSVGRWGLGLALLVASALCDLLDGAVARAGRTGGSRLGAALDSTVDRYGEGLILIGILADRMMRGEPEGRMLLVWLWGFALIGSFLTSYVRARAEGMGLRCEVGIMERPERLALLGLLLLVGVRATLPVLGILALGGHVTFLQRLAHVHRSTSGGPGGGAAH